MKTGVDGLEGQRPRLTYFSATAARNRFQTALAPKPLELPVAHAPDKMILLSMILQTLPHSYKIVTFHPIALDRTQIRR